MRTHQTLCFETHTHRRPVRVQSEGPNLAAQTARTARTGSIFAPETVFTSGLKVSLPSAHGAALDGYTELRGPNSSLTPLLHCKIYYLRYADV